MKSLLGWCWFIVIQVVALVLAAIGVPLIAVLVAGRWWVYDFNFQLHEWRGGRLTWLWGNDEDGIFGYGHRRIGFETRWEAFYWCALRNPVNNLRFVVRGVRGVWFQRRWRGWYFQAGFRPDRGWPVLSAGRGTGTVL